MTKRFSGLLSASLLLACSAIAQNQPPPPPAAPAAEPAKPAMLGVVVTRITDELRYQLPLIRPGAGLIVRQLRADGPAARANLATMDILLAWNDQSLVHPAQLQVLAESAKPGDTITLEYLHRGVLTKSQVVLAEKPSSRSRRQHRAPAAQLRELLGNDLATRATDALAESGIDPQAVAGMLKGADFGKLDIGRLDLTKLNGATLAIISPDGQRREIQLGEAMQGKGNFSELLKGLDLAHADPATLLASKIMLIKPDGTQQEIDIAALLRSSGAFGDLLKGLRQPQP